MQASAIAGAVLIAVAGVAGGWGLRQLAHIAILRGLRAPRVPHPQAWQALQALTEYGIAADAMQQVRIAGPGGKQLSGWLVSPPCSHTNQHPPHNAPAVLVMHGWGANASMMGSVVPPLHAAGFAVLLLDARCHGSSDDEPFTSMPRFAEDIAAGLAWLRTQPGIAANQLALLGHSVGAGACLLHAAHHDDVCAVVSLSAFAHPTEVMRRWMAEKRVPYPVIGWYVLRHVQRVIGTPFSAIAPVHTIARVRCPVLLVHGNHDATVPVSDAQRLRAAATDAAQLLLIDGDHDLREAIDSHAKELVGFLQDACS